MTSPRPLALQHPLPPHLWNVHQLRQLDTGGVTETVCGLYGTTLVSTKQADRVTCSWCNPDLRARTGPPVPAESR